MKKRISPDGVRFVPDAIVERSIGSGERTNAESSPLPGESATDVVAADGGSRASAMGHETARRQAADAMGSGVPRRLRTVSKQVIVPTSLQITGDPTIALDHSRVSVRLLHDDQALKIPAVFINRFVLGQKSEFLQGQSAPLRTIEDAARVISVPDFTADYLQKALSSDPNSTYDDILCSRILLDSHFRDEFKRLWTTAADAITQPSPSRDSGLAKANAKELSAAQVLLGAPTFHTPTDIRRINVHDSVPEGFTAVDWSWVSDWCDVVRNEWRLAVPATLHLPRLTSQGLVLKSSRDTVTWRLASKVLLASLARRCTSAQQFHNAQMRIGEVWKRHGYEDVAYDFAQNVRRQATRKDEPVTTGNCTSFSDLRWLGVSHYEQSRNRGVFMAPEMVKVLYKGMADGLKLGMMYHSRTFTVVPDQSLRHQLLITKALRALPNGGVDDHGDQIGFCDLSSYDTTVHRGFFDVFYERGLPHLFPEQAALIDESIMRRARVIAPISWGRSAIAAISTGGWCTLSGESFVTVKNNFCHVICYLQSLSEYLKCSPLDIWRRLEDPNDNTMELQLLGDDCMRYFGDDLAVYDYVDKRLTDFGLSCGRELAPAFLKKQCVSDAGTLRGITGSLMKNRFSEYGVKHPAVLTMGLCDTWRLVPSCDRDAVRPLWQLIGQLGMPGIDPTSCPDSVLKERVIPAVAEYAAASAAKARAVQNDLERMFYSNGEQLPDYLESLWGSLQYDPDEEAERLGIRALSYDELLDVVVRAQEFILSNDGKCPELDMFLK